MILLALKTVRKKNGTKNTGKLEFLFCVPKTFAQLFPQIKYNRFLKYSEKENLYIDCNEFMYKVVWLILLAPRRKGRSPCTDAPTLRKTEIAVVILATYSIVYSSKPKD